MIRSSKISLSWGVWLNVCCWRNRIRSMFKRFSINKLLFISKGLKRHKLIRHKEKPSSFSIHKPSTNQVAISYRWAGIHKHKECSNKVSKWLRMNWIYKLNLEIKTFHLFAVRGLRIYFQDTRMLRCRILLMSRV